MTVFSVESQDICQDTTFLNWRFHGSSTRPISLQIDFNVERIEKKITGFSLRRSSQLISDS